MMWDSRIGQRTLFRPASRWASEFKMIAGVHWSRTARRREDWKKNSANIVAVEQSVRRLVQQDAVDDIRRLPDVWRRVMHFAGDYF